MRNYIRYIVILVLIIAGGLLLISVVNKFTEPEKGKVDNSTKTEEKTKKPTVEMIEPTSPSDEETEESTEEETTSTPTEDESENVSTPDTGTTDESVTVPNTATGDKTEGRDDNIDGLSKVGDTIIVISEER